MRTWHNSCWLLNPSLAHCSLHLDCTCQPFSLQWKIENRWNQTKIPNEIKKKHIERRKQKLIRRFAPVRVAEQQQQQYCIQNSYTKQYMYNNENNNRESIINNCSDDEWRRYATSVGDRSTAASRTMGRNARKTMKLFFPYYFYLFHLVLLDAYWARRKITETEQKTICSSVLCWLGKRECDSNL